jgi:hypothetical protein
MKRILLTLSVTFWTIQTSFAQEIPEYTKTVDGIIEKLYASISGEMGEARDWEAFDQLVIPEARLIPTGNNEQGGKSYQVFTPKEYRENANQYLVENGFFEEEIYRVEESYGPVVHMFSTYISKRSKSDPEPFNRGINSIQLLHDGERYWVVTIFWGQEPDNTPLPAQYLPK